jgi:hypothetical protein
MSEFDSTRPAGVHDKLNDNTFEWEPRWAENYRQYADEFDPGVIEWDGRLLDGWRPVTTH